MNEPIDTSSIRSKANNVSSTRTPEVKSCSPPNSPVVSVCLCTYRRPQLLAVLLDSLVEQNFLEPFELIVTDNDSAGSAAQTVEAVAQRHPRLNIRYVVEPQKGISFARNTAASLAAGDFLAWIDDDETAAEDWLKSLRATQSRNDTDGVFGPVIPFFPKGSPSWPGRSGIFERPRHPTGTPIDARHARTGNALVKAHWFRVAKPFDPRFAHTGGEDYDFFARIQARGARFERCDEAKVSEMVPLERQQLGWILERRLRTSMLYWRSRSNSRVLLVVGAGTGGAAFIVLGLAGIIAAPFGLHCAAKLWYYAMGGLGRVLAMSSLQWKGY